MHSLADKLSLRANALEYCEVHVLHCASYSCSVFLILHFGSICFGCVSEFPPKDLCLVLPSIMWPSRGWLR